MAEQDGWFTMAPEGGDDGVVVAEAVAGRSMAPVPTLPRAARERDGVDSLRRLIGGLIVALVVLIVGLQGIIWLLGDGVIGPPTSLTARQAAYGELVDWDGPSRVLDGSGVIVCIVDTGIDLDHPDLDHVDLRGWNDLVNSRGTPYDDEGHGSAMAGLMVGTGGLTGHATGVDLLVAKALGGDGSGNDEIVADAIDWCVQEEADVISLSLGGAPGFIPAQFQGDSSVAAADAAIATGVIVVAAAGNDGGVDDDGDVASPSSADDVISVGGVDLNARIWEGSSEGRNSAKLWPPPVSLGRNDPDKKPELVAPAASVPVIIGDGWGQASGTSAATVYVASAMAMLLEGRPDLQQEAPGAGDRATVEQIKQWIVESVQPPAGQAQGDHDDHYGYGLLQVDGLLTAAGVSEV